MKKNEKKQQKSAAKATRARSVVDANGAIDWTPLVGAAKDALRWTHDLAVELSCDDDDEARIAGVFAALGALIEGQHVERVPIADILLVLRTVGAAIEHDQGITPGSFDLLAGVLGVAFGPLDRPQVATAPPRMPTPLPTIYHLAPHVAPRVMHAPSLPPSLAEVCALANRIATLLGPSGSFAFDLNR